MPDRYPLDTPDGRQTAARALAAYIRSRVERVDVSSVMDNRRPLRPDGTTDTGAIKFYAGAERCPSVYATLTIRIDRVVQFRATWGEREGATLPDLSTFLDAVHLVRDLARVVEGWAALDLLTFDDGKPGRLDVAFPGRLVVEHVNPKTAPRIPVSPEVQAIVRDALADESPDRPLSAHLFDGAPAWGLEDAYREGWFDGHRCTGTAAIALTWPKSATYTAARRG